MWLRPRSSWRETPFRKGRGSLRYVPDGARSSEMGGEGLEPSRLSAPASKTGASTLPPPARRREASTVTCPTSCSKDERGSARGRASPASARAPARRVGTPLHADVRGAPLRLRAALGLGDGGHAPTSAARQVQVPAHRGRQEGVSPGARSQGPGQTSGGPLYLLDLLQDVDERRRNRTFNRSEEHTSELQSRLHL